MQRQMGVAEIDVPRSRIGTVADVVEVREDSPGDEPPGIRHPAGDLIDPAGDRHIVQVVQQLAVFRLPLSLARTHRHT